MTKTERIDLHVHSTHSDGTYTPAELVALAAKSNLRAFALTDHDSISGVCEAQDAAVGTEIEVVSGVELSCEYNGTEVHMLGFYIDPENESFRKKLELFRRLRDERNQKMVALLAAEGLNITYDRLLAENPDRIITRGNIAKYLVDHGCVKNREIVFDRYLGDHCRCFVPREKIAATEAISLIHAAKGVAFLAHPLRYHMNLEHVRKFLLFLKEFGLDGVEAIYTSHQPGDERNMKAIAEKAGLMISGGSDFHGTNKPHIRMGYGTGRLYVPYEILPPIRQKAAFL